MRLFNVCPSKAFALPPCQSATLRPQLTHPVCSNQSYSLNQTFKMSDHFDHITPAELIALCAVYELIKLSN